MWLRTEDRPRLGSSGSASECDSDISRRVFSLPFRLVCVRDACSLDGESPLWFWARSLDRPSVLLRPSGLTGMSIVLTIPSSILNETLLPLDWPLRIDFCLTPPLLLLVFATSGEDDRISGESGGSVALDISGL